MVASNPDAAATQPALSPAELLYGDFAIEHAATRRMLERYPDGKGDWRPHARSRTLAELATHVADIVNRGTAVLRDDGMEVGARPPLPPMDSARELLGHFDGAVAQFSGALSGVNLAHLAQPWQLRRGGRVLIEHPRRILLRQIMMSHLIHHRAQLGVYYRLLDIAVPGTYDPSADD